MIYKIAMVIFLVSMGIALTFGALFSALSIIAGVSAFIAAIALVIER